MSRREFRVAVESPRPGSALVMVGSATATLAVTGQVSPFAVLCVAAAIAWSFAFRDRPHPLQRSGVFLNLNLAVVAATSTALWMRGALAIESLALFAMLAQALQLVDARPRRSEFLLVALALFQVVLAANLTDSLLFPPLLVVFAVTTVWTLMVHTIRAEALEAGDPGAARRVLTAGLFRMTLGASLVTLLIASAIFPLLPRVRSGAFLSAGFGSGLGFSGFSDRVALGDIGRIRLDPQIALRVETLSGDAPPPSEAYWRGLAFDRFDGRSWSVTPAGRENVPGFAEIGLALGAQGRGPRLDQRIVREPVTSGVLFTAGKGLTLQGAVGRVERDHNGGLYASQTADERLSYEVVTAADVPSLAALRLDRATPPREGGERYLELPPLDPRIAELARSVTADAATDADRARELERYLRRTGRYTDSPPAHGSAERSPVESFLLDRTEGHCEYFASGMVVMARAIGLPARLVNGFAGGALNEIGGFVEVRRSDAHSWVEIHYRRAGWVRYDPTPLDLRLAGAQRLFGGDRLAALRSALEYWWFRNVIDFDRARQAEAVRGAWRAWHRWRSGARGAERDPRDAWQLDLPTGALLSALLVGGLALAAGAALARRAGRSARREPPRFYVEAVRLVTRRTGKRRPATLTARAFAASVRDALGPGAADAFARVTDLYLAERFGDRAAGDAGRGALRALRDSLRA